jgi:hypothetical protein
MVIIYCLLINRLILGMSAAQMGTMDVLATKKISTQLDALLPQTGTELPQSHTTQVVL